MTEMNQELPPEGGETEEQPSERLRDRRTKIAWIVFFALISALMIACVIVIELL